MRPAHHPHPLRLQVEPAWGRKLLEFDNRITDEGSEGHCGENQYAGGKRPEEVLHFLRTRVVSWNGTKVLVTIQRFSSSVWRSLSQAAV